jgi:hypothetical protein
MVTSKANDPLNVMEGAVTIVSFIVPICTLLGSSLCSHGLTGLVTYIVTAYYE